MSDAMTFMSLNRKDKNIQFSNKQSYMYWLGHHTKS